MSDSCQSSTERNASSSTYSTDLSRPSSFNHRGSFFVENDDGHGPDDEGSRRGISVYLNDSGLLLPATQLSPEHPTEDSGYSPSSLDQNDRSLPDNEYEDTNKEDTGSLSYSTAAFRNDSTFSAQSSEDLSQFTTGIASFARIRRPLPPVIAEGSDIEDLDQGPNLPNKDNSNDSVDQGKQCLQLRADSSQFPPSEDLTNITTDSMNYTVRNTMINNTNEPEDKPNRMSMKNNDSKETVSTWVLLDENEPLPVDTTLPYRQHLDKSEPGDIDEVSRLVKELEQEVSCNIERPLLKDIIPRELKTPHEESLSESPLTQNNTLPRTSNEFTDKEVPVLPSLENSERPSNPPLENNEALDFDNPETLLGWPIRRSRASSRPKTLTYSQVDIALEALRQFQLELLKKMGIYDGDDLYSSDDGDDNSDHESHSSHEEKDYVPTLMPAQRLDSQSIDSKMATKFWQKFSIWRVLLLITICLIIPPFFFMIAIGSRTGFPDFKIIRLITHKNYRAKIWKGFLCDVDVKWFRRLSLGLGIAETLGVCAGIAIGFGVGLGTE